jgi:DNA-binding CsgD family transcriptional regulator
MANDKSDLVSVWENNYCKKVKSYKPFTLSQEISSLARLLAVGRSYYYVLNFHNMELDCVHGETKNVLGLGTNDFSLHNLLDRLSPLEYEGIVKKERLIAGFRSKNLNNISDYKIVHSFNVRDGKGNNKLVLHQSMPLSVNSEGIINQVIGVQTDITHLNLVKDQSISFINLNDGVSYRNVDPIQGFLSNEKEANINNHISKILTPREIHICRLIAKGLNSNDISDQLKITTNTVNTHRRKILKKSNCTNSSELINKFFTY